MADATESKAEETIDESLYSRQLYVMGHAAQRRMMESNVLLIGLKGLGVEIAKNIILAGVKSVTLYDPREAAIADLSSQFYLSEQDVGKPRAESCVQQLAELNNYVRVSVHSGALDKDFLSTFRCIVATDATLEDQLKINAICHESGIGYIQADARGLFANIFCDFGEDFTVYDKNGENPSSCMVTSVEANVENALVTVSDDARHNLETGDYVTFAELRGLTELNGCEPRRVTVKSPYTFTIGSTVGMSTYERGGLVNQVKMPSKHTFKCLEDALVQPGEFLMSDFGKFDRPPLLHLAFRALGEFGLPLPRPGNAEDANRFVQLAIDINNNAKSDHLKVDLPEGDDAGASWKNVLRKFAMGSRGDLSPMAAAIGGIVGQEVMKACSGKFMPINQWFYFDAIECLSDNWPLPQEEYQPEGSRYDGQIAVFGRSFVAKVRDLSYFLVGSGAIGCEMLKNWALMGVATSGSSTVHLTDMDTIEKSNLNRQFLFRPKDVGSAKSTTAGKAAMAMNPGMNVKAYEDKVAPETEGTFGDEFFNSLSGVCTALDNVEARLYVDQRCLYYRKPMLESGTLGTKGNTQLVLPYKTENYGASRDPPEKSIPICTLKNFPYQIEHTIQWARDFFEGTFTQASDDANQYLGNNEAFLKSLESQQNVKLDILQRLHSSLVKERPTTFEECIEWARLKFEELFANNPKQLLHNFPVTMQTSSGQPFWSGHKRAPKPLVFSPDNGQHMDFIVATANLRAYNYGINGTRDLNKYLKVLSNVSVPAFSPKEGVKIAANEKEAEEMKDGTSGNVDDKIADDLIASLPNPSELAGYRMNPCEFEKDDDTNFHIDFITACSNLRATNYAIENADKFKTKLIAGKIIPALATTTATVTGLVCLELYKIVQDKKLENFKNAFVNLAIPLFAFSEPVGVKTTEVETKNGEWNWSIWDRIDVTGPNMTLNDFIKFIEEEYKCEINMLSCGVTIVYSFFFPPAKRKERGDMALEDIVSKFVLKRDLDARDTYINFEVCAVDDEDEDVDLPYVRYYSGAK